MYRIPFTYCFTAITLHERYKKLLLHKYKSIYISNKYIFHWWFSYISKNYGYENNMTKFVRLKWKITSSVHTIYTYIICIREAHLGTVFELLHEVSVRDGAFHISWNWSTEGLGWEYRRWCSGGGGCWYLFLCPSLSLSCWPLRQSTLFYANWENFSL